MRAPTRRVDIAGELWELRGDMESGFAFAELTGQGLEDAFSRLRPLFRAGEIVKELAALDPADPAYDAKAAKLNSEHRDASRCQNDPRLWIELLYAFSAGYRAESGWDNDNWEAADSGKHPLDRRGFKQLLRSLTPFDVRRLKDKLLDLYTQSVSPPMTTVAETEASAAPVLVVEAKAVPQTGDAPISSP